MEQSATNPAADVSREIVDAKCQDFIHDTFDELLWMHSRYGAIFMAKKNSSHPTNLTQSNVAKFVESCASGDSACYRILTHRS